MTRYAVLIDGGGTSSKGVAVPMDDLASASIPASRFRVQSVDAPLNVVTIGADAVNASVRKVFSALKVPQRDIGFLFCGLAGVDTPEISARINSELASIGLGGTKKPAHIQAKNDLHIGLNAEHRNESAATGVLISGTGCNSATEDRNEVLSQVGGTGFLLGDRGRSGSWLGGTALTWAIEEVQTRTDIAKVRCSQLMEFAKRWKKSILLSEILTTAHDLFMADSTTSATKRDPDAPFLSWIHSRVYLDGALHTVPDASRVKLMGAFARPAVEAAARRDRQALEWTDELGKNLAELHLQTIKKARSVPDRVALVGGLIARKGPVQAAFHKGLELALPERKPRFTDYADQGRLLIAALRGAFRRYVTGV